MDAYIFAVSPLAGGLLILAVERLLERRRRGRENALAKDAAYRKHGGRAPSVARRAR